MMIAIVLLLVWAAFRVRIVHARDIGVLDGDSIVIKGIDCRMLGIDSPEWNQPQGPASTAALKRLTGDGYFLLIWSSRDYYLRRLVRLYRFDRLVSVSNAMVRTGHAFSASIFHLPAGLYARIRRRGMWGTQELVTPAVWRAMYGDVHRPKILKVSVRSGGSRSRSNLGPKMANNAIRVAKTLTGERR